MLLEGETSFGKARGKKGPCNQSQGISGGRGLWVRDDEGLAYYASGTDLRQWIPGGGTKNLNASFNDLGNIIISGTNIVVADRGANIVWQVTTNNGTRTLPIWMNGKAANNVPDIVLEAGFTY